jgi:chromosome segregation ATPase
MRASRDAAEGRAESAESDASIARTAQNEAFVARDDALYAARQLRSRLEVVELALQRTQADAEYRARAIDELQAGVTASIKRAETAEAATTGAILEKEAAQKRAGALEREITRVGADTDSVRVTLATVGQKHTDADSRARDLAELLALAQSKLEASEHSLEQDASRIASLERSNAIERDNRIAAEAEVTRLRDELSRRPPLDVLRSLDIDSLMQRNLQAAAAMQSLLQFVNPHQRSSTASGLFSSTGDA